MSNYLSPYRKLITCAKWALFSNPITYYHVNQNYAGENGIISSKELDHGNVLSAVELHRALGFTYELHATYALVVELTLFIY